MTIIVVPYKFNVYLYITREESTIIIICRDRNKWLLVFQLYSTYPFHSTIHLFPFWKFPHLPFLILKYYDKFNNLTKWIYHSKHWWISKELLSLDKWVSQKYNSDTLALGVHFDCLEKAVLVPVKPPQAKRKMERLHQQEA